MSLLQLIMLGGSAYFAFKIYEHIQTLQDPKDTPSVDQDNNSWKGDAPELHSPALSPFSAQELVEKADEAFSAGEAKKALSFLTEADMKAPNDTEILFKLGYISASVGDAMSAIGYYKRSLEKDKNDAVVQNALASVYRSQKEFASAKMHLNDSLEIDNTNPITYYNYANLLCDMGNEDVAIDMYTKAIELNPEFQEAKTELERLKAK